MGLGCGAKVLKYCLFAFNLVFFIAGIVCLGVGVWLIVDKNAGSNLIDAANDVAKKDSEMKEKFENWASSRAVLDNVGIILAVAGGVVCLIAFLGCCGAVKEWRPLLILYALCLMIILAVELAAAIYAAVQKDTIESDIQKIFKESIKFYNTTPTGTEGVVMKAWNQYMTDSKCCGIEAGETEWHESDWYKKQADSPKVDFPNPCCGLTFKANATNTCTKDNTDRVEKGCYTVMKDWLRSKHAIIIGVACAVAAIQLIGIIFAFCLCKAVSDEVNMV